MKNLPQHNMHSHKSDRYPNFKRDFGSVNILPLCIAAAFIALPTAALAQVSLPPVNLGDSSFLDGDARPGWLFQETVTIYDADSFRDNEGSRLLQPDDVRAVATVTQVAFLSAHKLLGANVGAEVLVPVVHTNLNLNDSLGKSDIGVGDLVVAPLILQWRNQKLLGNPLHVRFNFNVSLPIGQYSKSALVNAGQDSYRINPHVAVTWLPSDKWEVSGRFHYLWVGKSNDPPSALAKRSVQPGQAVHFNLSASRAVSERVRLGVAGYYLEQISDDRIDGIKLKGGQERVLGYGLGLRMAIGKKSALFANGYLESLARNRPQGARLVVRLQHPF